MLKKHKSGTKPPAATPDNENVTDNAHDVDIVKGADTVTRVAAASGSTPDPSAPLPMSDDAPLTAAERAHAVQLLAAHNSPFVRPPPFGESLEFESIPHLPAADLRASPSNEGVAPPGDAAVAPLFFKQGTTALPARAGSQEPQDGLTGTLGEMTLAGLMELRNQIDARLPPSSLADVDLHAELVLNYHLAKELQAKTLASNTQANYKASVVNATTAVLRQLVQLNTELYNAERVKLLEYALEKAFIGEHLEVKRRFYDLYEASCRELVTRLKEKKN